MHGRFKGNVRCVAAFRPSKALARGKDGIQRRLEYFSGRPAQLHRVIVALWYTFQMDLAQKTCVPCEGGQAPLRKDEAQGLLKQVNGWTLSGDSRWISKDFSFKDFGEAFSFAEKVARIAEGERHHPDLIIGWGKATVELTTHAIKGLSENDFILAAKIDAAA